MLMSVRVSLVKAPRLCQYDEVLGIFPGLMQGETFSGSRCLLQDTGELLPSREQDGQMFRFDIRQTYMFIWYCPKRKVTNGSTNV